MSAWLEQRERGSIIGIRLMVGLALLVGRPIARLVLYPPCLYFLLFSVKPRAGSRKYLAHVLNRRSHLADLFRHYFTFAAVALDRFFLLRDRHELLLPSSALQLVQLLRFLKRRFALE